MIDDNEDESRGVEHLPQSELEASPGLSKPQTSIDLDKLHSTDATNALLASDDTEMPEPQFDSQPDESRGLEHLPQSELESTPGVS